MYLDKNENYFPSTVKDKEYPKTFFSQEDLLHPGFLVGIIFLFGLLLRLSLWLIWNPVISRDSIHYLQMAEDFSAGQWKKGLAGPYPPLYPFVISFFLKLKISLVIAGRLASLLGYCLSFFSLYFLFQNLRKSWVLPSLLLLAIHPYHLRYSIMVLSESLYLGFFMAGISLFFLALFHKRYSLLPFSSLMILLAYLTRPEGLLPLLLFFPFLLVLPNWKGREKVKAFLFLLLPFLFLGFPYLLYLKKRPVPGLPHSAKAWKITQKGGLYQGLQGTLLQKNPRTGLYQWELSYSSLWAFSKIWLKRWILSFFRLFEIGHPLFIFLALLSLAYLVNKESLQDSFILYFILFFWILIFCQLSLFAIARLSSRLVFQSGTIALFLTPLGLEFLFQKWNFLLKKPMFLLSILLISTLPIGLRPLGRDKAYLREGGRWIRTHAKEPAVFLVSDQRLLFYAQKKGFQVPRNLSSSFQELQKKLLEWKKRYGSKKNIWICQETLYPQKIPKKWKEWTLQKRFPGKKYTLLILVSPMNR